MASAPLAPRAPGQITVDWLQAVLRADGALALDALIDHVAVEAIGDLGGVNGEAYRLRLRYAAGAGPETLIAKFPAARASARGVAAYQRWYEREVRFYAQLASGTPLRTPRRHAAEIDPGGDYVLLLEDLRPRAQGDQLAGCSVEQARAAVEAVARLHARWWGDAAPPVSDWLPETTIGLQRAQSVQGALARAWARARDTLALPRAIVEGTPRLVEAYPALLARMAAPPATVVHGDYRLDNLFFGATGEVAAIDWQFVCRCRGTYDVAYFVGLDLEPAVRRAHEHALLDRYVEVLAERGVAGYGSAAAWEDYRRSLLLGFAVFLIGAGGEQPNARMARVHAVGLDRLAAAIAETDAFAAIDAP